MKIKNRNVESTPFFTLYITDKKGGETVAWCKMYWTENSGMYGHQVCMACNYGGDNYTKYVTGGCGYSKSAEAFNTFLRTVPRLEAPTCHYEPGSICYPAHKGGNYHECSIREMQKILKGNK